jgi:hypothetical protein
MAVPKRATRFLWIAVIFLVVIAVAAATTRPIVGMFFAFRRLTPHEFFGTAFWLGFTITFLAAKAWVDYTRQQRAVATRTDTAQSLVA